MLRLEKRVPGNWRRGLIALLALSAIVLLSVSVASAGVPTGTSSAAQGKERMSTAANVGPVVERDLKHDVSPPLRDIPPVAAQPMSGEREIRRHAPPNPANEYSDPVVQWAWGPLAMPTPIITFAGINSTESPCGCLPPDTNGEAGPNHYVQIVNTAFRVYSKSTGAPLGPVTAINTLWSGFGGPCQTRNDGDPVLKYDELADRWVVSQFTTAPPFNECIAVSTSGDPLGSYNRYAFALHESASRFGDYPKIGVWPDAYYMSDNEFNTSGTQWLGAGNYAFDRTQMLLGSTATYVYFGLPPEDWGGQQPSDWDGSTPPPAGAPNMFMEVDDSAWDPPNIPTDQIQMWRFHVDFATPANSTFTPLAPIVPPDLAPFDGLLCDFASCVPQPGTSQLLDTLSDRLMYRVAYRNFGDHELIVFNHTVDVATNKSAIRWYEIRGISGTPSIFQQGTYDPTTDQHWMGSMAMDQSGDIALGYSVSSTSTFPSIRYTGRMPGDPLGTLPQGEATIINGTGSQTHSAGRWGDYSALVLDPVDDCTFWYTTEYLITTSSANWQTRIGSFKFPGCGAATPTPTATDTPVAPTSTPTSTPTNTPLVTTTSMPTDTNTPIPGVTDTPTTPPEVTNTSTPVATDTPPPGGATATPTACLISFTDVPPGSTFYDYIRCMACRGIINGYTSGCESGNPCFKPNNNVTRGQLSKIVSNSAGFDDDPGPQRFEDVPLGSTFYDFIGRLASRDIIAGYPCGGPGEPCVGPGNLPYFRPNANVTRGQISKIVSEAAGYSDPVGDQQFQDVLPGSTFYDWIWRLTDRGIMNGYACGGVGEPCVGPANLPYFRPGANATRGQASKIVANTFLPGCYTPLK